MSPCKQHLFTLIVQLVIGCVHTPFTISDNVSHERELVSSVCIRFRSCHRQNFSVYTLDYNSLGKKIDMLLIEEISQIIRIFHFQNSMYISVDYVMQCMWTMDPHLFNKIILLWWPT